MGKPAIFLAAATPETIWQVPAYLPYLQPPLTKAAVRAAEEKIGYKLPIDYLNLFRRPSSSRCISNWSRFS